MSKSVSITRQLNPTRLLSHSINNVVCDRKFRDCNNKQHARECLHFSQSFFVGRHPQIQPGLAPKYICNHRNEMWYPIVSDGAQKRAWCALWWDFSCVSIFHFNNAITRSIAARRSVENGREMRKSFKSE